MLLVTHFRWPPVCARLPPRSIVKVAMIVGGAGLFALLVSPLIQKRMMGDVR